MRHGLPVRWTGLQGAHGEGVPQIVHPHARCSSRSTVSKLACQPDEHDMRANLVGGPSSDGDEQVITRGAEPCPCREICFECLAGRRLQCHEPLLAELAIANDQPVFAQIVTLQREGFGNPQASRCQ